MERKVWSRSVRLTGASQNLRLTEVSIGTSDFGGIAVYLTVVVPTYNEGGNPRILASALAETLRTVEFELIFVDDSRDPESIAVLQSLSKEHSFVRVVHRTGNPGLGIAVAEGLRMARGDMIVVMDADLQHPPELVRSMVAEAQNGADIVVPSRFIPSGDDGGLDFKRKVISFVARGLCRLFFWRVRKLTDPTSGFFLVQKGVLENIDLRPTSWKILLEILVKGRYQRIVEIPYRFAPRASGTSKMSLAQQLRFIGHLFRLLAESPDDRRKYVFAAVGSAGVFVNMIIYVLLVGTHLQSWQMGAASGLVAMFFNFVLNDRVTWRDVPRISAFTRLSRYALVSLVGIGISIGVLAFLERSTALGGPTSNLLGIFVAMLWSYYANNYWTWRVRRQKFKIAVSPGLAVWASPSAPVGKS